MAWKNPAPAGTKSASIFSALDGSDRIDVAQSGLCALLFMTGVAVTNTLSPMRGAVEALSFIFGFASLWALLYFEAGSTKKGGKITAYAIMAGLALLPVPVYKLAIATGFIRLYFLALLAVVLIALAPIERIDNR